MFMKDNIENIKTIILTYISVFITIIIFASCGNRGVGYGNFDFKHIHIKDGDTGYCATVTKWYEGSTGIEVTTKEYGAIFCSEGTYVLFENNKCPFCNK